MALLCREAMPEHFYIFTYEVIRFVLNHVIPITCEIGAAMPMRKNSSYAVHRAAKYFLWCHFDIQ